MAGKENAETTMTITLRTQYSRPKSSRPERGTNANDLSRRTIILASPALVSGFLGLQTARAQQTLWREYRRDDLGFRIEMPSEPMIEEKDDEFRDIWVRSEE